MAETRPSPRQHAALDLVEPPGAPWPEAFADTLALAVDGVGALAVDDTTPGVWRLFFGSTEVRDEAQAVLSERLGSSVGLSALEVEDEGWATRVQDDLRAVRVGRFVVAPPWDLPREDAQAGSGQTVILIEPSTGFGTGHHQSTRLCLHLLATLDVGGRRVIDVGTGSGVLAIAARHLGAREVVAFDVDPDAIASARANVALNHVDDIAVVEGDLAAFDEAPADIVLGNLTMFVLRQQREPLARLVAPGGALVASGFTRDQVDLVREAFGEFVVERREDEDDWVGLVLRRGVRS